ncbi:MAG: hypothetical protein ACRDVG_14935 [Jatrophihabitantaceae bacterium]
MRRIAWRRLLVWTLPVLAFAWLAVASRADSGHVAMPPAGSLLGGGAVGTKFVPLAGYQLHFTTVSMENGGKSVRFYGDWNGRCQGFSGAVTASFWQRADVKGDGTFSGRGPLESTSADGTYTFAGRFTGTGNAEGTGRVVFTFHSGSSSYTCDTGTVSWQTRTSLPRFGRPRPDPGHAYFGNTTQRLPMVLRVSPDGRSVEQQAALWNATCKVSKAGLGRATSSPRFPIRADGTFGFTERYTEAYGNYTAHITSTHEGRFGLSTAAGTWRVHVDVVDSAGHQADTCDSGPMRWAVRI